MIENINHFLSDLGINEKCRHFELFYTDKNSLKKIPILDPGQELNLHFTTVVYDGKTYQFQLNSSEFLLDQCLDKGLDLPFACKGAVCSTCRAKVLRGNVNMINNYALTPQEVRDGYVLTCQSVVCSNDSLIDFDTP
jgi:ring-1,2-phenylacetyl-CoA epoxidase subunit PaaE